MLDSLKYEDYAPQINTKFQLAELENIELELIEVTEKTISPVQEMFSLTFCGSKDIFLPQNTYRLRHKTLGEGELFLVPIGVETDFYKYEAGFNRLIKS